MEATIKITIREGLEIELTTAEMRELYALLMLLVPGGYTLPQYPPGVRTSEWGTSGLPLDSSTRINLDEPR